ncbi:uncharacterized protein LOC144869902 [Branchiostoma floridae x Branchiostoma japonicum]
MPPFTEELQFWDELLSVATEQSKTFHPKYFCDRFVLACVTMQNSHWERVPSVQHTGDAQSGSHDNYALQGVEMKLSSTIAPTNKVCLPVQYSQNSHSKASAVLAEANYDFSVERRVLGMDVEGSNERS